MFEVVKQGLETSVQELPGRIGYWEQGFPPSGPADAWSFRLANLLVGNDRDTAALECQFIGPTLRFGRDGVIALTGADMAAKLDDAPVPTWQTIPVRAGQMLTLGPAKGGVRAYIAFDGGIDTPVVLGSRATFHMAGVGGVDGYALKAGQSIPLGAPANAALRRVGEARRPVIAANGPRVVECMLGPNDDWLDAPGIDRFFSADWLVQAKSNRTGMRLTGPEFTFSARAHDKRPEHGRDPSNILDHGYPLGAINLAGQTPIILIQDAPSTGGFINPFTVPSAALWKLGQTRPGEIIHFRRVDMSEAQAMRRALDAACTDASLDPLA
ncbi:biotin-dependent carboxyltransferase [Starkeya sp. ORNL1]|uniref:5-oxoprolinase subunit C family protein n=1 Tax=Starkeya sp. ORNL1 TaxID=2709380 RepID=UPI001464835B|nr:biotin-dependent carboxyltransferase family protein [Starkeya sp. ORNL1]QJP14941.1 biotin-dependent carboxyltransferase [Starkeya sp. ORNL1]